MAEYMIPQAAHSFDHKQKMATSSNGFRIAQQKPGVLFSSRGGVSLPAEICLKIVEEVVSGDPKVGSWALKTVSKVCNRQQNIHSRSGRDLLTQRPSISTHSSIHTNTQSSKESQRMRPPSTTQTFSSPHGRAIPVSSPTPTRGFVKSAVVHIPLIL